ncbi:MAG: DUF3098 domain-containing protein [Prevotellaceae bacterium]|nr:DUF3098 domain-containing protein [Candidatus Faecinaster equi]
MKNTEKEITTTENNKRDFAFGKLNWILLVVGVIIVIIGFILMAGDCSTDESFNYDSFNALHTKVAPLVSLIGFLSLIVAILIKKK